MLCVSLIEDGVFVLKEFQRPLTSFLMREQVLEVRKKIADTSPCDSAWDTDIVPAAIDLMKKTLPELSTGFGDGVVVVFVALWVGALGSFAEFLRSGMFGMLVATAFSSVFPLLLALDVADASSACDHIRSTLNDKRAEDMSVEADTKIQVSATAPPLVFFPSRRCWTDRGASTEQRKPRPGAWVCGWRPGDRQSHAPEHRCGGLRNPRRNPSNHLRAPARAHHCWD